MHATPFDQGSYITDTCLGDPDREAIHANSVSGPGAEDTPGTQDRKAKRFKPARADVANRPSNAGALYWDYCVLPVLGFGWLC